MTAVHKKAAAGWAGFSIGGMIFLLHLVGVPLTGASMNPARTGNSTGYIGLDQLLVE